MQHSYRHQLRAMTRIDHQRLDDLFSALDIARRVDYAHFVSVHLAVFEVLQRHLAPSSLTRQQLLAGLACLQRDLATLGERAAQRRHRPAEHGEMPAEHSEMSAEHGEMSAEHGEVPAEHDAASSLDPLAVDYVVAGSRLGLKVLKTRWASSSDPLVRAAGAYFTQPNAAPAWPKVCRALSTVSLDSARAGAITRDTKRIFDLFAATYRRGKPLITERTAQ